MASQLCAGKMKLLLLIAATLIPQHSTTAAADEAAGAAGNSSLAKPGCPDKCGNISIPYPFGIGKQYCFLEGFEVLCTQDNIPILNTSRTPLLGINLTFGEARIQSDISQACNISQQNGEAIGALLPVRRWFRVSRTKNIFTAIGCSTIALIGGDIRTPIEEDGNGPPFYAVGACGSFCGNKTIDNNTDCSGRGCCQSAIPRNLKSFFPVFLTNNLFITPNFSRCSYAFIAEVDWFKFRPSYVRSQDLQSVFGYGPPLVLDWVIGNASCSEATAKMGPSYACVANNSMCVDGPSSGPGYRCNCKTGYQGNPYLEGVCTGDTCVIFFELNGDSLLPCMADIAREEVVAIQLEECQACVTHINECDHPSMYPCMNGTCTNTIGGYICSCPPGTQSKDPKNSSCTPITGTNQPQVKVVIGIAISFLFLIICVFSLLNECQKRKLAKEKERFFRQNGGHILYQKILSRKIDTVVIFTIEDLKKATDNFDRSKELGAGGHGTVYKGVLGDNKVIAVKRSKIINLTQTEEFVQEIIILSQINHKNVIRLLGCCLEVEVPILVYEFIPNGTLFELIHENHGRPPVSLEDRLRIAQESAEALEYLHISVNQPIVHGDVKSLNILLDDNYTAKVIDFGASRMIPKDAVQFMTMVQGTLGYLDPEYLQEQKLTEKRDVYSFGIVLLELITRKTAIYFEGSEEGKTLSSSFLEAMKGNRVEIMLDSSIMSVGMEELFQEVIGLASWCLSLKGEERPSMTQVADKLKAIRSTWREILLLKHEETQRLIERLIRMESASPSMSCTAQMLGMDIEMPTTYHTAGSTSKE